MIKYDRTRSRGDVMDTIIPNYDIHILNEHRQIIEQLEHQPISKLFNIDHIEEDVIAVKYKRQYHCWIDSGSNSMLSYNGNCWVGPKAYINADGQICDNALLTGQPYTGKYTKCIGQNITIKDNALIYCSTIKNRSNNSQVIISDNAELINSKIIIEDNIKTNLIISGYTTIINTIINIEQYDNETCPEYIHIMNSTIGARDNGTFDLSNDINNILDLRICNKHHIGCRNLNIYTDIPYGSSVPKEFEENIFIDDTIL
jgi:hypothetical protein